jgi:hypothetical protein
MLSIRISHLFLCFTSLLSLIISSFISVGSPQASVSVSGETIFRLLLAEPLFQKTAAVILLDQLVEIALEMFLSYLPFL